MKIFTDFKILKLPFGKLYQYESNKRTTGDQITEVNTTVTDPNGKVVYEIPAISLYDSFQYESILDGNSYVTSVVIDLSLLNEPTTAAPTTASPTTGTPPTYVLH
jgi:hypothetical protein